MKISLDNFNYIIIFLDKCQDHMWNMLISKDMSTTLNIGVTFLGKWSFVSQKNPWISVKSSMLSSLSLSRKCGFCRFQVRKSSKSAKSTDFWPKSTDFAVLGWILWFLQISREKLMFPPWILSLD